MKKLAFLFALSGLVAAEPIGFSPTLPFGIPSSARTTRAPVNTGGPGLAVPYDYNGGFGYYYYYGGGSGMAAPGTNQESGYGATLPSYTQTQPKPLDSYSQTGKRKSDTLPGY